MPEPVLNSRVNKARDSRIAEYWALAHGAATLNVAISSASLPWPTNVSRLLSPARFAGESALAGTLASKWGESRRTP